LPSVKKKRSLSLHKLKLDVTAALQLLLTTTKKYISIPGEVAKADFAKWQRRTERQRHGASLIRPLLQALACPWDGEKRSNRRVEMLETFVFRSIVP